MAKNEQYVTGPVELNFPKVSTPDDYGDNADGKYKTNMVIVGGKENPIYKHMVTRAKELLPTVKKPKMPFFMETAKDPDDKDGERIETGRMLMRASSKFIPVVTDKNGQELPEKSVYDLCIGGGTIAKVAVGLNPFKDRLALYLNGLQLIKLVAFERKGGKPKFGAYEGEGADEGFVFDKPEQSSEPEEDAAPKRTKGKPSKPSEEDDSDENPF